MARAALAIHGGAGTILRSTMTAELEAEYRSGLEAALRAGWSVLDGGGTALDAAEAAVVSLEDFPLFNAGRGAVFTHEGKHELDASIMDGRTLGCGAVAFVRGVKNPVKLARLVMERTEHILLGGPGADQFAREMAVDIEDDAYFFTEHRYQQLLSAREEGVVRLDHTAEETETRQEADASRADANSHASKMSASKKPLGTVGAAACDNLGNVAAATSTGGMTNKKFGRIGDTPLIGAGTFADDLCAVSCTGHGEFFIRGATAYDVAARMRYKGISLDEAASETIGRLTEIGGEGGLVAVDSRGNVSLPFNSDGMYRGWITADGKLHTAIYS